MKSTWILVCLLLLPASVKATTVRYMSEKEMVQHAATIVRGTVESVVTRRDNKGAIVTDVTIRVQRTLKAQSSEPTVTLTQLGGTIDGVTMHVPGTSHYRSGEAVVVFLERGGGRLVEIGVGAGK